MVVYTNDSLLLSALSAYLDRKKCTVTNDFPQYADVCAVVGNFELAFDAGVLLVDSSNLPHISGNGKVSFLISCGMGEKDSVTFSALGSMRALLCVQRNIQIAGVTLECGEFPVDYDENLSIWHNLVISLCKIAVSLM